MIKLIIKSPGMFINIPGLVPFRTPAEIDISKINANTIISELNKNGITKYKIICSQKNELEKKVDKVNLKNSKNKVFINKEIINQNIVLEKIEEQQKIIENIEKILLDFLNSDKHIIENKTSVEDKKIEKIRKKKIEIEEDKIIDYIPSINLSKVKRSES